MVGADPQAAEPKHPGEGTVWSSIPWRGASRPHARGVHSASPKEAGSALPILGAVAPARGHLGCLDRAGRDTEEKGRCGAAKDPLAHGALDSHSRFPRPVHPLMPPQQPTPPCRQGPCATGLWVPADKEAPAAAEPLSAGGKARVCARGCEKRKDDKKGTFPQQREETPQKPPSPQPREVPKPPLGVFAITAWWPQHPAWESPYAGCPRAMPAHAPMTSPPSLAPPHPLPEQRGDPPTQLDTTSAPQNGFGRETSPCTGLLLAGALGQPRPMQPHTKRPVPRSPRATQSPKSPCASCHGRCGIGVPGWVKPRRWQILATGVTRLHAPHLPQAPWPWTMPQAAWHPPPPPPPLQSGAQTGAHPDAGSQAVPSPRRAYPTPCHGWWEDLGGQGGAAGVVSLPAAWPSRWRRRVPARVTPAGSGGVRHRQDHRVQGQGGGREKKREREKKSGRTHPLTGKGVVREVANSTEEFRPFLGKPRQGPAPLLAARRGAGCPNGAGAGHSDPAGDRAGPCSCFPPLGWIRRPPQAPEQPHQGSVAGMGTCCRAGYGRVSRRQPGHNGTGTAPWPRNQPAWLPPGGALGRICPQSGPWHPEKATSKGRCFPPQEVALGL